jgi:ribosome biogenesis GTPase
MHNPDDAGALTALGFSEFFARQLDALTDNFKGDTPARVCIQHRGRLTLLTPDGATAGAALPPPEALSDDPIDPALAVGDWVLTRPAGPGELQITRALTRRTRLVRKTAGRRSRPQLVGANLDRVFLVTSMNADFSPRRLERYLAAVLDGGAEPVVVLTKADLRLDQVRRYTAQVEAVAPDTPVIATSALLGVGLDELAALLGPGLTVGFVGSSGVGKSSLVNALLGEEHMVVSALRQRDETGQHTTTHRELIPLPDGRGVLLDTPGMRELQPWGDGALGAVFADLEALALSCRYRDCQHESEPGCAIQAAIDEGDLDPGRLDGWQKLQRDAARLEGRKADWQLRQERRRFSRMVRRTMSEKVSRHKKG